MSNRSVCDVQLAKTKIKIKIKNKNVTYVSGDMMSCCTHGRRVATLSFERILSLLFSCCILRIACLNSGGHGRITGSKGRQRNNPILPSPNSPRSKANSLHSNRPATSHPASSHILPYTLYSLRTRNMDTLPLDNSSHPSAPDNQRSLSSSGRNENL